MTSEPVEDALTELERGRRGRGVVIALLVAALLGMVVLVLVDAAGRPSVTTWAAVGAAAVVAVLYGAYVLGRESAAAAATRALLTARADDAAERSRERALEALHSATRAISGTLDLTEVTDRTVAAASELTAASDVQLLLRIDDELAVIGVSGDRGPARGSRRPIDAASREVLEAGTARSDGDDPTSVPDRPRPNASFVVAPLALPDRAIGLLEVRRGSARPAFSVVDRLVVALLAEHAALALRNATRHDLARQRADAVAALVDEGVDEGVHDPGTRDRP